MGSGNKTYIKRLLQSLQPKVLLEYNNIVRHVPMILLLAVLAVLYIWNRHSAHRQMRELQTIRQSLQEKSWEYATLKKELNNKSMQTEVSRMVRPLGLEELTTPPFKIKSTDDDQE